MVRDPGPTSLSQLNLTPNGDACSWCLTHDQSSELALSVKAVFLRHLCLAPTPPCPRWPAWRLPSLLTTGCLWSAMGACSRLHQGANIGKCRECLDVPQLCSECLWALTPLLLSVLWADEAGEAQELPQQVIPSNVAPQLPAPVRGGAPRLHLCTSAAAKLPLPQCHNDNVQASSRMSWGVHQSVLPHTRPGLLLCGWPCTVYHSACLTCDAGPERGTSTCGKGEQEVWLLQLHAIVRSLTTVPKKRIQMCAAGPDTAAQALCCTRAQCPFCLDWLSMMAPCLLQRRCASSILLPPCRLARTPVSRPWLRWLLHLRQSATAVACGAQD